jgi:hypothetical protein
MRQFCLPRLIRCRDGRFGSLRDVPPESEQSTGRASNAANHSDRAQDAASCWHEVWFEAFRRRRSGRFLVGDLSSTIAGHVLLLAGIWPQSIGHEADHDRWWFIMAGPRRRKPDPDPPSLGGIVIDGANVIASSRFRPIQRLDLVMAWCHAWRHDLPVQVFIDNATAMRCQRPDQATLRARCADVTEGRPRYVVCPRGESADGYVLKHAREHACLVISNDRFWDFQELRIGTIVVQFSLKGDAFTPYAEATWFRPPDHAIRVAMADLKDQVSD